MSILASVKKYFDWFTLALVIAVLLAVFLPATGDVYTAFNLTGKVVVAALFFLHGLKLSPSNLWAGLTNWRLHVVIVVASFILFPILGLALKPIIIFLAGNDLYQGVLFVCVLPSTVQSSIAFTSIAGGNVAAAVCAASFSSLLGVFVTPVLVNLLMRTTVGTSLSAAIWDLCVQLVFPFVLGQALRPFLANWVQRRKKLIGVTDRLSVIFIVYVSFSRGTTSGLWGSLSFQILVALLIGCALLLGLALLATSCGGRLLGFPLADRIVIVFCGSKKSLITGVPMANIIFPPELAGVIILPLMFFHQMQLVVCSLLAKRYAVTNVPETGY
ncbi:MAG: bile acid:sodium symporter [Deltaproteobacteria bacterium]|jgi:sodium/bile acid cotransporter 7|nr:bile acid:sodium symporter [Deltaproteobacteria bacterium]